MTEFEFDNSTKVSRIMRRLGNRIPGLIKYKLYYKSEEVGASKGIVELLGVPDSSLLSRSYPYSQVLEFKLVEVIAITTNVKVVNDQNPERRDMSFVFNEARTSDRLESYIGKSSNSELNELIYSIGQYCNFDSFVVRALGINVTYTTLSSASKTILEVLDRLKDEYDLLQHAVITIEY
ncbi:hypothetical protein GGF41_008764, partial [Coemansia sp. RSA 2531]